MTLPEENIPEEAVIFTVPSTASGVMVALGLEVARVNAWKGEVRDIVLSVQVELVPPLTIFLGARSSCTSIYVSADCVNDSLERSISPRLIAR